MKRKASYSEMISWIAEYDDNDWLEEEEGIISVTGSMLSHLFDIPESKVRDDIKKAIKSMERG